MATNIEIEITLDAGTNTYVAAVDKTQAGTGRGGLVRWKIQRRDGFPNNARVILQFVDSPTPPKMPAEGPFIEVGWSGGKSSTTGNFIYGGVGFFTPDGRYNYTISYDDNGTEKLLLDPEIVVDGNATLVTKFLKALAGELKLLKLADSKKPKKGAAKKAKQRRAKAAPKRKAKKR